VGGPCIVYCRSGCADGVFLVVSLNSFHDQGIAQYSHNHTLQRHTMEEQLMTNYLVPFVIAFVVCALIFLGLDIGIMKLQGLSLIFQP